MGFTELVTDAGLTLLNNWLKTRSYIVGYTPSQADVKVFQQVKTIPAPEKFPYAWRWYNHILTWESEFDTLPGDPTKDHTAYGPEQTELPVNPAKAPAAEEEDDEVDLFGSDEEEDEEAEKLKAERLAEYNKKKAGKVKPAAKSIVTMDVKPWDDETDLEQLKANVLAIEQDGLTWGASKFVAVGFGIKKLQINLVVEDDKVSTDELQQKIEEDEDHVQSTDIVAMQKL
ncbi:elongation factor 1 beta subunit [Lentithecium fluviatile CBS 122367]|uniref:Elongation factor 1 beta subunit n=1 Tax=Lentithecium fluviatile CBS 122367 TaxID=1168545 RepID=A0A6G1J8D6_9PLEO|nr:elongation factor 1 beta subunit [Lentithecium fluviatile CBS 122367]